MTLTSLPLSLEQVQMIRKRAAEERATALAAIWRELSTALMSAARRGLQLPLRYKLFPRRNRAVTGAR